METFLEEVNKKSTVFPFSAAIIAANARRVVP